MAVLSTRGPMAVLSRQKQTDGQTLQISTTNCIFAITPHDQFITGRAKLFSAKAGPLAVLSTRGQMAVLSRQKQTDGQTSRFQRQCIFVIIPHDQFITGRAKLFSTKAGPMAVLSTRGPMTVLLTQNECPNLQISATNCIFRYYPARSIYERPGQAILSKSKPNGRFINARPNGRFIKAEANGWPDLQISATNCIFAITPHDQFHRPGESILSKSRPNGRFINARPNGRFIKAEANGWPDLQISATNCIFVIIPHDQFITGRAKLFSAKASPMAVLSTRGPMAVLSRQKQTDGQTSRFQQQIAFFVIIPHDQFISGRAKLFLAKASPMAVLSTRGPMANGWPDLQISATNCIFAITPHDEFITGRANLFSAKAGPMAVLSTRGPMAVLSRQKQTDGQTSRFQRQIAFSLLSRTISLSAAGLSYS